MEAVLKRKSVDLPADVLARLSAMAVASGRTLKSYMENVLTCKAEENPSPSNDPWFDDPENMKIVKRGIKELEEGKGKVYTASQLKARLGL